jgi:hypothetical protein
LGDYYKKMDHKTFSQFVKHHPKALSMYFETFAASKSGKYINGTFGLAKNFNKKITRPLFEASDF